MMKTRHPSNGFEHSAAGTYLLAMEQILATHYPHRQPDSVERIVLESGCLLYRVPLANWLRKRARTGHRLIPWDRHQ